MLRVRTVQDSPFRGEIVELRWYESVGGHINILRALASLVPNQLVETTDGRHVRAFQLELGYRELMSLNPNW